MHPEHSSSTDWTLATDGCLVQAVLDGQREQFAELVRRYQDPLLRLAESRLGRRDWAEDAVQEAFLCAFQWLASYDSRYSFRTWLWTIVLNQCRRHYKRRVREQGAGGRLEQSAGEPIPAVNSDPTCPEELPLARLLRHERHEQLRRLLDRLPEVQADAVRLRFFGGLKFQEIADTMGCSLSSAKNRVRWGLVRLSQLLGPIGQDAAAGLEGSATTGESDL